MFEPADVHWRAGAYTREKFPNFCVGVLQAPKKLPQEAVFWVGCLLPGYSSKSILGGVLATRVQLKQHDFGRQESLRGLVYIPKICFLYAILTDVRFWHYDLLQIKAIPS